MENAKAHHSLNSFTKFRKNNVRYFVENNLAAVVMHMFAHTFCQIAKFLHTHTHTAIHTLDFVFIYRRSIDFLHIIFMRKN